jgi:pimeloyl-ACP methyl ester carboxylesterase
MSRPLAWAVAVALIAAPTAVAQPKIETKAVTFDSADGVELQGTIYKSAKGPGSPCVILLHSLFTDPNKGDWDGLALTLAEKGYTVLRFDFRGHGKSFVIDAKKFWADQANVKYMPALARKNPLPVRLDFKDFAAKPNYAAQLANDILAARVFLDKENDGGTANTSTVYLIGATDAATLGMLYMSAEWKRPSVIPQAAAISTLPAPPAETFGIRSEPAGADIAGAVWLSATLHPSMPAKAMKDLVSGPNGSPDMREKNPMWFLYGEQDKKAATGVATQRFFYNDVLVAKPAASGVKLQPVKFTEIVPIKGSEAVGVALLGNKLGTEEKIFDFLEKIEKDRKAPARIPNRNYTRPPLLRADLFGAFAK